MSGFRIGGCGGDVLRRASGFRVQGLMVEGSRGSAWSVGGAPSSSASDFAGTTSASVSPDMLEQSAHLQGGREGGLINMSNPTAFRVVDAGHRRRWGQGVTRSLPPPPSPQRTSRWRLVHCLGTHSVMWTRTTRFCTPGIEVGGGLRALPAHCAADAPSSQPVVSISVTRTMRTRLIRQEEMTWGLGPRA